MALYYLTLFFLVMAVWAMRRIVKSLLGRTFIAIRNSDELAEALGINLMRNKTLAFMLSVFYAGMAGGLYAGFVRFIGPDLAGAHHTFDMMIFMIVGGLGTVLGPAAGRHLACHGCTQSLQFLQEYRFIVFGPILVALVIFLPHGIVGSFLAWRARRAAKEGKPMLKIEHLTKTLRRAGGGQRRQHGDRRPGKINAIIGPGWRGQDHVLQPDQLHAQAHQRHHHLQRARRDLAAPDQVANWALRAPSRPPPCSTKPRCWTT